MTKQEMIFHGGSNLWSPNIEKCCKVGRKVGESIQINLLFGLETIKLICVFTYPLSAAGFVKLHFN